MNRIALFSFCVLASATNAHADSFVDRARVLDAHPLYETVQAPRQECTVQPDVSVRPAAEHNYGGAIIGGVAGGILGNQVGKGHGREAATAVGAVIGALAGDHIANQPPGYAAPREVRSCRTVYDAQQRLTGYSVRYEYRGETYSTVTREQPGPTLPVRVTVSPMDEREYRRQTGL